MKIALGQFELDTDEMSSFRTGIQTMPVIYVNATGATFVQTFRPRWELPRVRRLGRAEALRLAQCCNIRGLKERLMSRDPAFSPPAQTPAADGRF